MKNMNAINMPDPTPIRPNLSIDEVLTGRTESVVRQMLSAYETRLALLEEREVGRWPAMMPPSEAANYLGISPQMLNTLVRDGHITPTIPYGMKQRYYNIEELDRWRMESQS